MRNFKNAVVQTLTLFGSLGTLLCCALPAVLVSFGAGAVVATIVSEAPQLVWLSEHKVSLFGFAAVMLGISGVTTYLNRRAPCPADPVQAKSCERARRLSATVFVTSLALYAIGFYFAFVAARLDG